jgi:septum formation protein
MAIVKQNCQIILASGSAARKQIMTDLAFDFTAISPDFDEEVEKLTIKDLSISKQALHLAKGKALSISKKHPKALVIGSDQICQLKERAIDKSKNRQDAINQLKILQGQTHFQNNAVCLYRGADLLFENCSIAALTMRHLSDEKIINYVDAEKSWGCAGSYKFESLGRHLFSVVKGSDSSIVGMDMVPLLGFFHQNQFISL